MDATGFAAFSALALLPLIVIFWLTQRLSRRDLGLSWGQLDCYTLVAFHPLFVMGTLAIAAWFVGQIDTGDTNWKNAGLNIGLSIIIGPLMAMLTEEGFFRGVVWGLLKRAGQSDFKVLMWTTIAFTLWHVSVVAFETEFSVPTEQIPIYMANVALLGGIWGVMRLYSGSVIVPAMAHAIWNGLAYSLFGFGEKTGALGIEQTHRYGPEVGFVGVALNLVFLVGVIYVFQRIRRANQQD